MDSRNHREAELELLQRAAEVAEPTPERAERMKAALERYAQARAFLDGRSGSGPIDKIRRVDPID